MNTAVLLSGSSCLQHGMVTGLGMSAAAVGNTDAEVGLSAGCQAGGGRAEDTAFSPGSGSNPGASLFIFSPCPLPHLA